MPIQLPNLDDIDYDALMAAAIAALPGYGSEWTDYNPSDPGITVLEVLAWLTEMLIYRTNRIQSDTYRAFLELLLGNGGSGLPAGTAAIGAHADSRAAMPGGSGPDLNDEVRGVLIALQRRYRAITAADYEQLALTTFAQAATDLLGTSTARLPDPRIERLICVPGVDVTDIGMDGPVPLEGAISLVVLPTKRSAAQPSIWPSPSVALLQDLRDFFEPRRLATTRVCLAGPRYVPLQAAATVYVDGDAQPREVLLRAQRALFEYLHPVSGGSAGNGWAFGQTVYAADLTARLAVLPGVAFVENVRLGSDAAAGESVSLGDDQLPQLPWEGIALSAKVLRGALSQKGSEWIDWAPEVSLR